MSYLDGQVPVLESVKPDQIPFDQLFAAEGPVILRGLVSDWSLVQAGKESPGKAMDILQGHSSGKPVGVYIAPLKPGQGFFIIRIALALITRANTCSSVRSLLRFAKRKTIPIALTTI